MNSVRSSVFSIYNFFCLLQGTTGVLVLARTKALARELSQQFRARAIDKSYLALLVHGDARRFTTKEGLIDASLSFDDGRVRVQDPASGDGSACAQAPLPIADAELLGPGDKAARTTWEVLASSVSRRQNGGSTQSLKKLIYIYMRCNFVFSVCAPAGYRAVVASTPVSTYGVEAPAARAHGARFER